MKTIITCDSDDASNIKLVLSNNDSDNPNFVDVRIGTDTVYTVGIRDLLSALSGFEIERKRWVKENL